MVFPTCGLLVYRRSVWIVLHLRPAVSSRVGSRPQRAQQASRFFRLLEFFFACWSMSVSVVCRSIRLLCRS